MNSIPIHCERCKFIVGELELSELAINCVTLCQDCYTYLNEGINQRKKNAAHGNKIKPASQHK